MERQAKDGTFYKQVAEDEWEPVTRPAKDGTIYKKVGADDWEPLEMPASNPYEKEFSAPDTAFNKFTQGATLGYGDELEGLERSAIQSAAEAFGLRPEDGLGFMEKYQQERDARRGQLERAGEERPGLSMGAEIAGGIASGVAAAPLMPGVAGATVPARLGQAAKVGAAYGAVADPGNEEGINPLQPFERIESAAKGAAFGLVLGAGGELAAATGRKLSKASQGLIKKFNSWVAKDKPDADEIRAAAEALGVKATPGMTVDSRVVENLESSLAKSPTVPGMLVRRKHKAIAKAMEKGAKDLTEDATQLTKFEAGEKAKGEIAGSVDKMFKSSKEKFSDLRQYTKDIPVTERSAKAVSKNIMAIEEVATFESGAAASVAKSVVKVLDKKPSANQIKSLRTMVGNQAKAAERAGTGDSRGIWDIYHKLGKLEENTIKRGVLKAGQYMDDAGEGIDVYHGTMNKFKAEDLKPSKGGYFGEGFYLSTKKSDVRNYGDLVHKYRLGNKKILDISKDPEKLVSTLNKFAKKHDLDVSDFDPASKYSKSNPYSILTRAVKKKFKIEDSNGSEKLTEMLKADGYSALRFRHNDSSGNLVVFDRSSIKTAAELKAPSKKLTDISKGMLNQLRSAKKEYSAGMKQIEGVGKSAKIKGKNLSQFKESIEDAQAEKLANKFFDLGNKEVRNKVEKMFPEAYETLRKSRLSDIKAKSMHKGDISPYKLIRNVDKLEDEALKDLFSETMIPKVMNMKKIKGAFPADINPSGTGKELAYGDLLSLATRQVGDIGRYAVYKTMSNGSIAKLAERMSKIPEFKNLAQSNPKAFNAVVMNFARDLERPPAYFEQFEKKKGKDKWAADGFSKMKRHLSDEQMSKYSEAKLKSSKKGRDILAQISTLKPDSKAFKAALKRLEKIEGEK